MKAQTERLSRDGVYPLHQHVDKRWALLGEQPAESTAARQILEWLDADGPRFVLVLGDFGTGKTFLLRVLAQELAGRDDFVPVLVTMRDLEKRLMLDELLAQHFVRYRSDDSFHAPSFRYLLREGRIMFVVVVAVDSRWLASSLQEHYVQLSGQDAVPEDYLEKIFQVPFWVRPLGADVRQQMLRGLLAPSLAGQAVDAAGEDDGTKSTR